MERRCLICSSSLSERSPKANTCSTKCWNELRRMKRGMAGASIVGALLACKECGAPFNKQYKRQFYCPPCSELSARDYLPSQRARVIAYQSERNKRRRKEIPSVSISERMSAGIKNSLRDGKQGRSWEALVGYTVADLVRHLERQFPPRMSWENRDSWHIDHIVPLAAFKFDTPDCEAFKAAWALSNLRPLWSGENIKKSASRLHLL